MRVSRSHSLSLCFTLLIKRESSEDGSFGENLEFKLKTNRQKMGRKKNEGQIKSNRIKFNQIGSDYTRI